MSALELEIFLARLYTDAELRARFNADPEREARRAGLSADECTALKDCDRVGMEMAAESFGRKRARQQGRRLPFHRRIWRRLLGR